MKSNHAFGMLNSRPACAAWPCCSPAAGWTCTFSRNICRTSQPISSVTAARNALCSRNGRARPLRLTNFLHRQGKRRKSRTSFRSRSPRADLERGRQRYNIYCTPCHEYTGSGNGMIVQRGFPPPPSFHIQACAKRRRDISSGDDQWLRRDVQLRGARGACRSLEDRGVYTRAAIEPARDVTDVPEADRRSKIDAVGHAGTNAMSAPAMPHARIRSVRQSRSTGVG